MGDHFFLPYFSKYDPPPQTEGSLDPLGLYAIADALAVKLAPGVRERQRHPRYLTMALAGMAAWGDELAELGEAQGLPPWLVYEWLVVAALVQAGQAEMAIRGVPGRDKVLATLRQREAICRSNYLKTPEVFGFHGIYRTLGMECGLFDDAARPLEPGFRLLKAWQCDQGLNGFLEHKPPGENLRRELERAIRAGLQARQIKPPATGLRDSIAQHLHPFQPGPTEREALWEVLTQQNARRGEYLEYLISKEGRNIIDTQASERALHEGMLHRCSPEMRRLLLAIQAYEHLARLLIDAFNAVRHRLTQEKTWLDPAALGQINAVRLASKEAPSAWRAALPVLEEVEPGLRLRLTERLAWLEADSAPASFTNALLEHHEKVQAGKPPNGKRSWFDRRHDGRIAIRPAYVLDASEPNPERYVHAYRTAPLRSFAHELGRLPMGEDQ